MISSEVLKTMTKGKMDENEIKEKCEKHKRPSSVEQPVVPKVNPKILGILDHSTKTADLKLQRKQKMLIKAVHALAYSCNTCVGSESQEMKNLVKNLSDAVSLNLKVVHEISLERRSRILTSPNINKKYRKLSTDLPVTDFLFGNDLKSVLSSVDSTSKFGLNYVQSSRGKKSISQKTYPGGGGGTAGARAGFQPWIRPRGRGQRGRGR